MQPFAVQSEAVTIDVGSGHFAFSSFTFYKAKTRKREIISFPVFAFTYAKWSLTAIIHRNSTRR